MRLASTGPHSRRRMDGSKSPEVLPEIAVSHLATLAPQPFMSSQIDLEDEFSGIGVGSDELLTVEELAAILKVPKSWIYLHTRKRSKAALPHVKIGKYLRFCETEVREFLSHLRRN